MQLINHPLIDFVSPLAKKSTKDGHVQTTPLEYKDAEIEAIQNPQRSTQTNKPEERILSSRQIKLSEQVVDLMVEQLKLAVKEEELFRELDEFHRNTQLQLMEFRRIKIDNDGDIPISALKCEREKRICVLFGEQRHESWCLHSGKVLIWENSKANWISLESCPTHVLFAPQRQVIVGTATGTIVIIHEQEIIWSTEQMHFQALTSLRWISPKLILSTGLDGRLVVSSLQPVGLEPLKSALINVSDLPRTMRKSVTSATRVSAAASAVGKLNVYVASDTGALLQVDSDSLSANPVGYDPDGIVALEWIDEKFLTISATDGQVKIMNKHGHVLEWLDCRATQGQYCRMGKLFLFLSEDQVVGFDVDTSRCVLRQNLGLKAINFTPSGDLVGVDGEGNLIWYEMNSDN